MQLKSSWSLLLHEIDSEHNSGVPKDPRKYLVLVFLSVPIKVNVGRSMQKGH